MTGVVLGALASSVAHRGPRRPTTVLTFGALLAACSISSLAAQAPDGAVTDSIPTLRLHSERIAQLDFAAHPSLAPSPDGRFVATLQTRPDPVLWILPADRGEPFAFRRMWAAYAPRWSPSGQRIGFIAGIGPPRIWTVEVDPETGRPLAPPRLLYRTAANAFAFSPDGGSVAFVPRSSTAAGASAIHIVDWESRRVRTLMRARGLIYRLDWAPDGESIYYGQASELDADSVHAVVRVRVQDGASRPVMRVQEYLGLSPDGTAVLYRPLDAPAAARTLAIADPKGTLLMRIDVAKGSVPGWGASSATLLQLRRGEAGDEIRAYSLPVGLVKSQRDSARRQ